VQVRHLTRTRETTHQATFCSVYKAWPPLEAGRPAEYLPEPSGKDSTPLANRSSSASHHPGRNLSGPESSQITRPNRLRSASRSLLVKRGGTPTLVTPWQPAMSINQRQLFPKLD